MSGYDVVVIGASWGGMRALGRVLADLPADFPTPIVVAQHRDADAEDDLLPHLLARHSRPRDRRRRRQGPARARHGAARAAGLPPARSRTAPSRCRSTRPCSSRARRSTSCSSRPPSSTANARSASCSPAPTPTAPPAWRRSSAAAATRSSRTRRRPSARRCPRRRSRSGPNAVVDARRARVRAVRRVREPGRRVSPLGETPNVLLVDDRPENLLALEAVLAPLPCKLVSVTSGQEALRRLLHDEFALILLDVQMPDLDGFETAEYIKRRRKTRAIPIIFVTAISKERHHVFRGYETGAVDYVFKPYDPQLLRAKVQVFLELHEATRAVHRSRGAPARDVRLRADRHGAPGRGRGDPAGQPGAVRDPRRCARARCSAARSTSITHPEDLDARRDPAARPAARRTWPATRSRSGSSPAAARRSTPSCRSRSRATTTARCARCSSRSRTSASAAARSARGRSSSASRPRASQAEAATERQRAIALDHRRGARAARARRPAERAARADQRRAARRRRGGGARGGGARARRRARRRRGRGVRRRARTLRARPRRADHARRASRSWSPTPPPTAT